MVSAAVQEVHLRNAHPTRKLLVPLRPGWARLLYPGATTRVPAQTLHTPTVQQLLTERLLEIADGAAWDAATRQRRIGQIDMARAIAAAEQRAFDQLLRHRRQEDVASRYIRWTPALEARLVATGDAGLGALAAELGVARSTLFARRAELRKLGGTRPPHVRKRRADEWSQEVIAQLRAHWAAGMSVEAIAAAIGRTPVAVEARVGRLGLRQTPWRYRRRTAAGDRQVRRSG